MIESMTESMTDPQTDDDLKNFMDAIWQEGTEVVRVKGVHQTFFIQSPPSHIDIFITPWSDDREKMAACAMIRKHLQKTGALRYVLLAESWLSNEAFDEEGEWQRPSEQPDRREALIAIGVNADGSMEFRQAEIVINDNNERILDEVKRISTDDPNHPVMNGLMASLFTDRYDQEFHDILEQTTVTTVETERE